MNTLPPSYIAVYIISVKLTGFLGRIVDLNDVFSHWKIWLHSRRPRLENEPGERAEVVEDRFIHLQKIDDGLVELEPDIDWDPDEKEFVKANQRYLFLGVSTRQNLNQILRSAQDLKLRFGEYNILDNNCHDFVRALSERIVVEPQRVGDALNEPRRSLEYTFGVDGVRNPRIATRMLRVWLWPMLIPMARGKRTGSGGTAGQVLAAGAMGKEAGKEGEPAEKTLRDLFLEIQKQMEGEGEGEPTTEITT